MSKDPKYYKWLYSINGNANPGKCLVLNELPFTTPLEAIAFITKNFPEMTPEERPIVSDPQRISDIAMHSQHEVEYLLTELQTMVDDLRNSAQKAEETAKQCDGNDLLSQAQREVGMGYARDKLQQAIGILQAMSRLRGRKMELMTLAGKGRYSDWRL